MFSVIAAALAVSNDQSLTNSCAAAVDCESCIANIDKGCGWCAPGEIVYIDGTKGARCADSHDPKKWFCLGKMMTDQCIEGYVCTGPPDYQCTLSGRKGEGTPDQHACIDGCSEPPKWKCNTEKKKCEVCTTAERDVNPECMSSKQACSDQAKCLDVETYKCDHSKAACVKCDPSDDPAFCSGKSGCDAACTPSFQCDIPDPKGAGDPKCNPCQDPTGKTCFKTMEECTKGDGQKSFGCDWQYKCDYGANGPQCVKTAHGIPKKEWCLSQCHTTFTCNATAGKCMLSNSSSGQPSLDACNKGCNATHPPPPSPVPFELRGVWRGLAIQHAYGIGEWEANITANTTKVFMPDGSVYFSGKTTMIKATGQGSSNKNTLVVESKEGKLIGTLKLIYGDFDLDPELGYVALAIDESAVTVAPTDWDPAMTKAQHKVLGMYKCTDAAKNCKFHLIDSYKQQLMLGALSPAAYAGDKCNAFDTCAKCIGATAGSLACGWCTQPVIYNGTSKTQYQCAGWQGGATHGWKCYGQFRTATCTDYCCDTTKGQCVPCPEGKSGLPTMAMCNEGCGSTPKWFNCTLDGIYRGLEIDLGYAAGEWKANFDSKAGKASFSFTSTPAGKTTSFEGKTKCKPVSDSTPMAQEGEITITLANSSTFYGRYTVGGVQAETEGLTLALSELGSTVAPVSWEAAMLGVNATVYGYTKCASWKLSAGICKF